MLSAEAYSFETIKRVIESCGLKATQQRIVIYGSLLKLTNHPTSEQVYDFIKPANPSISLGTVYKTLDTFVDSNLVNRVLTSDGLMHYDALTSTHSHIYCTNTQEIIDFDDTQLQQLIHQYLLEKKIFNLRISGISVQIHAEKIDPDETITIK